MDESMGFVFEDPVTYEIMEKAVMAPCGHSFSETTVADWHKDDEETTCPVCNTNFYKQDVVPNYKLREAIDRYLKDKEARDKLAEDERRRAEQDKQRIDEERRHREELSEKVKREEAQRRRAEEEKARLEAEKERIEAENRRMEAEFARLKDQERKRMDELEQMRRQHQQLEMEREEKRRAEELERQRLEEDTRKRTAAEQHKLREREEQNRRREEEEKHRLEEMERRRVELERKLRIEKEEMQELRRKCMMLEEESRKTQEQLWSVWNYIPSVPIAMPTSWSLSSWIWGSSAPTGPLVYKFTDYKIDCRRGSHRNCPVWRAVEKKQGDVVALKKLPSSGGNTLVFREPMLHHNLSHPNILELKGIMRDETKNDVYMVLPFVEYDLDHAINAINTPFNTAQLRHLMNQLLLTVCYLHSAHIVHRDIQPTSIMLSHAGNGRIWLTSLGKARNLCNKPFDILPASSYLGYRAPEIILTAPHLQKNLSEEDWKAADVWSCGCILAQLLFKKPLFVGTGTDHQDRILKSILSYADCVRTLGDMPSRFTLLNTHPAIEAEPTRSLRQLFFPEEDDDEPPAASLRRKGKGQGQGQPTKGKGKAAVVAAPGRDEPLDLANAGAVAVMDERTKEEALDLLSKMLTFDPEQRITAYDAINHPFFACFEGLRERRKNLWQCPDDILASLRDENVIRFLTSECAGIV